MLTRHIKTINGKRPGFFYHPGSTCTYCKIIQCAKCISFHFSPVVFVNRKRLAGYRAIYIVATAIIERCILRRRLFVVRTYYRNT